MTSLIILGVSLYNIILSDDDSCSYSEAFEVSILLSIIFDGFPLLSIYSTELFSDILYTKYILTNETIRIISIKKKLN